MEDKNNVLITMVSRLSDDTYRDTTETVYPGKAFEKDGCCYVFYDEHDEDTGSVTRASLRLRHRHIEIRKKGNVTSQMVFVPGDQRETEYRTPYGSMHMTIDTKRADMQFGLGEVTAELDYQLSLGGSAPMRNRMRIVVRYLATE